MLRITANESGSPEKPELQLVLEGKLAGPWVVELESEWRRVRHNPTVTLTINLRGLDYISPEGKQLLCRIQQSGVRFIAGGVLTRSVLDEIRHLAVVVIALLLVVSAGRAQQVSIGPAQVTPLRLSLRDAVNLSLKQNPQVILANLSVSDSRQDQNLARSTLLPQLNASAGDTLIRGNIATNFGRSIPGFPEHVGPFWAAQAGTSFSTPVFDLTLWRRYQSAKAQVAASGAQETTIREQATLLVVSQYLGAQRAAADVAAAQSRVDLAQALFDQATDLQKSGVGTGIDTLRANVELQNESQRLIQARTARDTTLFGLARLLGMEATRPIELADALEFFETPQPAASESLAQAYSSRPEMTGIHEQERAAALTRKAAGAERLPSLHVGGSWSEEGLTPGRAIPVYEYSAIVSVPLFTGGRIQAERAKAGIALQQLAQQERDLRNRISAEVETAVAQVAAARSEVMVANAAIALAREEVNQARDRFQAGVADNIEVISAQDALARASDNQIAALYRFNQARADLAHATGRMETVYSR